MPKNRIHTTKDGRYTYSITDAVGKQHRIRSRKGERKSDFMIRCDALDSMSTQEVSYRTFGDLFQDWLNYDIKRRCSQSEVDVVQSIYRNHIAPYLAHRRLSDITRADVYKLLTSPTVENLSSSTRTKIKGCISRPYKWAINSLGMVLASPTDNLVLNPGKQMPRKKRRRFITDEEAERFFEAAKDSKYYPYFQILYHTGMRPSEALGLQARDVKKDHLEIRRGMTRNGVSELKTSAAVRDIPLTEITAPILYELRDKMAFVTPEGWLFPAALSAPSANAVKMALRNILKGTGKYERGGRNGQKILRVVQRPLRIRLYDFRHTFATRMAERGMPHVMLKSIMGHRNISITLSYYTEITEAMIDDARRIMAL
ncbi:MAG TPA: site-specific integrase [Clostridiaceae bacterium]|nr:site-specific integrase [Clostridiaceae bacterium]